MVDDSVKGKPDKLEIIDERDQIKCLEQVKYLQSSRGENAPNPKLEADAAEVGRCCRSATVLRGYIRPDTSSYNEMVDLANGLKGWREL